MSTDQNVKKKKTRQERGELTTEQKRIAEDTIRDGLREMRSEQELRILVNEAVDQTVGRLIFKRLVDDIRKDFQASSGFYRESIFDVVDKKLRGVITDDKSSGELVLKAIDKFDKLFDLKRRPEEDSLAIASVVKDEMDRIRGLSDKDLLDYVEWLKSPKLDEEFHSMVEAKKRGQLYAIERGEVLTQKGHTHNVTSKPAGSRSARRKPPRKAPGATQEVREPESSK